MLQCQELTSPPSLLGVQLPVTLRLPELMNVWACQQDHSYPPHIRNETDESNTLCRGAHAHLPAYLRQAAPRRAAQQPKGTEWEAGDGGYSKMEHGTLTMQR